MSTNTRPTRSKYAEERHPEEEIKQITERMAIVAIESRNRPQTISGEQIFNIELIYEPIFDALSPAALLRVALACRTAHHAVSSYTRVAFNVDRLLSRFFPSPTSGCSATCFLAHTHDEEHARAHAFRSLQARTGMLISGSTALQFFERTVWPESDLDLYVHERRCHEVAFWLAAEGYTYKPEKFQESQFEVQIAKCLERDEQSDCDSDSEYSPISGMLTVITFVKPLPRAEEQARGRVAIQNLQPSAPGNDDNEEESRCPKELKVQVIVTENTPIEVVFSFHSTCVMNVISYERAYCLFPRATLEERLTHVSKSYVDQYQICKDGLKKYEKRGYRVVYRHPSCEDTFSTARPVPKAAFRLGLRWTDDSSSWILPLSLTGIAPPPAGVNTCAPAPDPAAVCNWEVCCRPSGVMEMRFEIVTNEALRHEYLVADEQLIQYLKRVLSARMRVKKARLEGNRTYCDAELPALCREFLRG